MTLLFAVLRNPKMMRWHVVESIVWTWFMTLPATGLAAYGLMRLLQVCHASSVVGAVARSIQ